MITIHHLNQSRSTRLVWLLEELKMPYDIVHHQRDPITQLAPESLKAVHPLAKAPIMVDGSFTLCESGTIMEYLLNKGEQHRLRPAPNSIEYYQYLEWLHFSEGSLALPVITSLFMRMEKRTGDQAMDAYIAKEISLDFAYIEATLGDRSYFAGEEFSAADIMMTVMLEIAEKLGILSEKTNINAYLTKMRSRAAYQQAKHYG